MTTRIPIVVFGGRAYTAAELLRLLALHPNFELVALASKGASGTPIARLHPHVASFYPDLNAIDEAEAMGLLAQRPECAIVLCTGNGESAQTVQKLADAGILHDQRALVDLSGDFRLNTPEAYAHWYEGEHAAPEWLTRFDYCVPELHRADSSSKLVANPGCFATAVQFSLTTALREGLVEPDFAVFAVTGSSGSGGIAKPNTHHPARAHDFYAYKALSHQHLPEIRIGLGLADDADLPLVTHSAPLVRGISVTATFTLKAGVSANDFQAAHRDLASAEPMLSWAGEPPKLTPVLGTNLAAIGSQVVGQRAVVYCAIDNLTRGASGQALQNLNRVCGLPETTGLLLPGMHPF